MKKKAKELLQWFFTETDRGEENIANMTNLYELVERLQYRLEDMESEHMNLMRKMGKLEAKLDMLIQDIEQ